MREVKYNCRVCGWHGPDYELLASPSSVECPRCGASRMLRIEPEAVI